MTEKESIKTYISETPEIDICIRIGITPERLGDLFWGMNASKQVRFFERLDKYHLLPQQMHYVSRELTPAAKRAMQIIGEYGE